MPITTPRQRVGLAPRALSQPDQPWDQRVKALLLRLPAAALKEVEARLQAPSGLPLVRESMPVRTGELRRSVKARLLARRVRVVVDAPYARAVRYRQPDLYGARDVAGTLNGWAGRQGAQILARSVEAAYDQS